MPGRAGRWALFLILLGLLAYGLLREHLFAQALWNGEGLHRLELLGAVYLGAALLFWWMRPRLFLPCVAAFALFATVVATGPWPLLAAAFVASSALLLGDGLLARLGVRPTSRPLPESATLSFLTGAAVIAAVAGVAAHWPVNYSSVYLGALCVPVAANYRAIRYYATGLARPKPEVRGRVYASAALLAFVVLAHLLVAIKPEVSYDGLAVHLMLPSYVSAHHYWPFDPAQYIWAVSPLAGDWLYTAAYLAGGEFAARLINFLLLVAMLALLYGFGRRRLHRASAMIAVALFGSMPLVQLVTGSLFVENFVAAMILAALLALDRFRATRRPGHLLLLGLFVGTSAAAKFGALTCGLPLAAFAAASVWKKPRPALRHVVVAVLIALAAGAPAYVWAWRKTGSPIYPYASALFRSPFPGGKIPAWDSLYQLTFESHRYLESQNGAMGFQFLLLLPLTLVLLTRRSSYAARAALVSAIVSGIVVLSTQPYVRYLYPALALLTIPFMDLAAIMRRRDPAFFAALGTASAALVLLNLYFLPSSGWYQRAFYLSPFDARSESEEYVRLMAPARGVVDYLNRTRPGEAAWFIGTNHIAGLQGRAWAAAWHQPEFFEAVGRLRSDRDALDLARQHGIRNFVAPANLSEITAEPPAVRSFLRQDTILKFRYGAMALYTLKPGED